MTTTFVAQPTQNWYHVDANGQIVGRLACKIARVLMGKNKVSYCSHIDQGDFVVVTGAEGLRLTGRKEQQKEYRHHTGYFGGMRYTPFTTMRQNHADQILYLAVKRMLPKTRMGREMLSKLKVYAGAQHPHAAQKPQPLP